MTIPTQKDVVLTHAKTAVDNAERYRWASGGPDPITEGVHRIPLSLPLPGLPAVNVYVLESKDGLVLIDSGWQSEETRAALVAGLADIGYALDDISRFLITHSHWDHYTMAAELHRDYPCTLEVGAGDYNGIAKFDGSVGLYPEHVQLLHRCGADRVAHDVATRPLADYEAGVRYDLPDRLIHDGDLVTVTAGELRAVATPGHTRGHTVFVLDDLGYTFTGDHVLPIATPAIGNEGNPATSPLADFMNSLERLLARPDTIMLPAHGETGGSVHERSRELLKHHEDRLNEIVGMVRGGRSTALDVAADMPWTRHERRLPELDVVHQMTAVLEVDAHLQVLSERGLVRVRDTGDVRLFTAV